MHEDAFARLQFRVVEQHMLDGRERDRRAGGVAHGHAFRHGNDEPLRHVDEFAREAVDVESHDAADILTQIIAAFLAIFADAAGQRAVHDYRIAGLEVRDVRAGCDDFAGRFRANHQRIFALGECHAAKAPDVDDD